MWNFLWIQIKGDEVAITESSYGQIRLSSAQNNR